MILHGGRGKVKHLTPNQRWGQGGVRALEIDTQQIPHEANIADMSTHAVLEREVLLCVR